MTAQILTNYQIVRETEKASLVSTEMIVGRKTQTREFWMPKSNIAILDEGLAVATWLINKNENVMYHTYFNSVARNENGSIKTIEA